MRGIISAGATRIGAIDALRGGALLLMIFYHCGFDLNYLGWIHYDINYDQRWLAARTLILGSFLGIVGVSLALAEVQQINLRRKLLRIGKIVAAAGLVSVGSWLFLPGQTIYFGTLHAIALMSLILQVQPLSAGLAGTLGVAAIALGNSLAHPVFDFPALAWLGLMTHKPLTADYVPMLPWFGVCLIGYAAAKAFIRRQRGAIMVTRQDYWPQFLMWLGRHSLAVYLLHQPLLLAILIPVTRLLQPA